METDMELTSLTNEAMKLHPAGRVQLSKELLNSLEKLSKPEIENVSSDMGIVSVPAHNLYLQHP